MINYLRKKIKNRSIRIILALMLLFVIFRNTYKNYTSFNFIRDTKFKESQLKFVASTIRIYMEKCSKPLPEKLTELLKEKDCLKHDIFAWDITDEYNQDLYYKKYSKDLAIIGYYLNSNFYKTKDCLKRYPYPIEINVSGQGSFLKSMSKNYTECIEKEKHFLL